MEVVDAGEANRATVFGGEWSILDRTENRVEAATVERTVDRFVQPAEVRCGR